MDSAMTRDEINALLAEADGWLRDHDFSTGDPPQCLWCRVYEYEDFDAGGIPCDLPDYTTSYPDLARVERKVYGEDFALWLGIGQKWPDSACEATFKVGGAFDDLLVQGAASELFARAECCAKVYQQQQKEKNNADME